MDVPYPLTERVERVGDRTYRLVCLTSFEDAAPVVHRHYVGRTTAQALVDLSPMFGAIWGATRAIAARVDALGPRLRGRTVLELGCGLGLPSMVAAHHGATVLASDQHPHTGAFLARNLAANALDGVAYRDLDLRALPPDLGTFDLVLASDVLFAVDMPELVAGGLAATLAPGGTALLGDPGRSWLEEFASAARRRGLSVHTDIDRVQLPEGPDDAFVLTLRHGAA
ncbi:MAG: methyltransferase domain-containing protein [Alphaproteobacteria bacterium]|nr:methyltransferase domain-containing protein [Alphaproteobacteria bacterium]